MKQMLLHDSEELSRAADAPLLVQTQPGLVGFSWPISSWTLVMKISLVEATPVW